MHTSGSSTTVTLTLRSITRKPSQRNISGTSSRTSSWTLAWSVVKYLYTVEPSVPTPWNEDTSVYSGTPLFQHSEMRTPLYTVESLYSNTLKWGHLCIQWNSTPWNEDTSVYSGTPLFQLPEMRTPLYTVELLYSDPLKWGHLLWCFAVGCQATQTRAPSFWTSSVRKWDYPSRYLRLLSISTSSLTHQGPGKNLV